MTEGSFLYEKVFACVICYGGDIHPESILHIALNITALAA